jgi:hypothetical protein
VTVNGTPPRVIAGSVAVARAGLAGSAAQAGTPPFTAPSPDAYTEMVPPGDGIARRRKRRAIGVHHGQNGGCRRLYVHIHRVAHVAAVRNRDRGVAERYVAGHLKLDDASRRVKQRGAHPFDCYVSVSEHAR